MIVTRFAPSPSGRLHLGHAYSAALGHAAGGRFLLRIEDLDAGRCRPEFVSDIMEAMTWLGISPAEAPLFQSRRTKEYDRAINDLRRDGLAYPCFCTRADIAASLAAPHGDAGRAYPGTCCGLPDDSKRRASVAHSWRLDSAGAVARVGMPGWSEHDGRRFTANPDEIGDVILARKDAPASYHLACVVDDAASGVTLVVRGADLRASTPVQRLLQMLLGLPEPRYLHHALVLHEDGRRLAKRDHPPTLVALRESGVDGAMLAKALRGGRLPLGFRLSDA